MKTGNKIAFFYTAITTGIITVVTVVFLFFGDRLYQPPLLFLSDGEGIRDGTEALGEG